MKYNASLFVDKEIRRCGMCVNETTRHPIPYM